MAAGAAVPSVAGVAAAVRTPAQRRARGTASPAGYAVGGWQGRGPEKGLPPLSGGQVSSLAGDHVAGAAGGVRGTRRGTRTQTRAIFGDFQKMLETDPVETTRKAYAKRVSDINVLESDFQRLSDKELRDMTDTLRARRARGESLESLLPEAFACVREASVRAIGLRPFDVQLIGGMVLHEGMIAEMRTGEGKTLVSVLPAYLNALDGKGVHVVTVNDYLARRDSEWVGQVHKFLGLEVGLVQAGMSEKERRAAYKADVTYVTNSELGFDYLRDNLAQTKEELVLRDFNFCIIDEADSILIDEARTPLIISGPADPAGESYVAAQKIAAALERGEHYDVEEKQKNVLLTEEGYAVAEELLQVKDLYDPKTSWAMYLLNALKAKELFIKDKQYIVKAGEVLIVDEFTGRVMEGRRWSDGLHQAVEAKESLEIQKETVTLASITYQNFFRSFPKTSGMTGTASTEETEFGQIYNIRVRQIPTNRQVRRKDFNDVTFRNDRGKWNAIRDEIDRMHESGRPVLVGTTSVEQSEALSAMLTEDDVPHRVLNAKPENVEREAEIVSTAGRLGAVTISTNMAGRGTDIILGGNADFMARLYLRARLFPQVVSASEREMFEPGKGLVVRARDWSVPEDLFPCDLPEGVEKEVAYTVEKLVRSWGKKALDDLDAEEKLAFACEKGPTEDEDLVALRSAFKSVKSAFETAASAEREEVLSLGGLHVVGTERHESRRIDNQLRGRAGRQGDPGSTRFFLSLEDNLFRIFGGEKIKTLMSAFRVEDLPIESKMLTKSLDGAQEKVEAYFYDIRKQLFDYDQVLSTQREKIYSERRKLLLEADLRKRFIRYAEETMSDIVNANVDEKVPPAEWDLAGICRKVAQYCSLLSDLQASDLEGKTKAEIDAYLRQRGVQAYEAKEAECEGVQPGLVRDVERFLVLSQTDSLWKDHLRSLKFLQQTVGLRGYGGKDPLVEYRIEGSNLFQSMAAQIRRNVIYSFYQFTPKRETSVSNGGGEKDASGKPQNNRKKGKSQEQQKQVTIRG